MLTPIMSAFLTALAAAAAALAVSGVLAAVVVIGGSLYFYAVAVKRSRKDFLKGDPGLQQILSVKPGASEEPAGDWLDRQPTEAWSLDSPDGLRLRALWLPAAAPTAKTVVLAHGYTSRGRDTAGFARFYRESFGYNVLMPDARGHGESDGAYLGFGWPDRLDLLAWVDRAVERVGPRAAVVLHGISMGGATVMMAAGEALPPQVKAIVEDCGYSSVAAELSFQLRTRYGLPAFPFVPATSLLTKRRAGYSFYEASAVAQVRKADRPMLFIHGADDSFVPAAMLDEVYAACPAPKQKYLVAGAGHAMAFSADKEAYIARVGAFLAEYAG
jgi:fermentation-respiration switch protein FrsA (DUF1100 family)